MGKCKVPVKNITGEGQQLCIVSEFEMGDVTVQFAMLEVDRFRAIATHVSIFSPMLPSSTLIPDRPY